MNVLVERRGRVTLITLNRPEVRNALTIEAYAELDRAIRGCPDGCIVLTGAGSAFCSGDDVRAMMGGGALAAHLDAQTELAGPTEALLHTDVPVIAAVNGVAVGFGMELALMADVRIASTAARFGEAYVLRGLCPDVAGMGRLAGLVGRDHATRLLLTGEIIDAHRAAEIGLVSEVVQPDRLESSAMALAERIAANPPLAVGAIKQGLRRALDPDWYEFGRWVRATLAELARSEDHRASVEAFLAERGK